MPLPILRACAVALLFGCAVIASTASTAEAKRHRSIPAELRVAGLADQTQYTNSTRINSDPGADCFGPGTGGSGDAVTVPGATALGLVVDAGAIERRVRPVSVTDAFDFGLGLCGIGRDVAPATGYWYLKVNHVGSQTGGDQTKLTRGDSVLWYLISDFNAPIPDELEARVPARASAGESVDVKVVSYADDGTRTPASGVTVSGADAPTGANGVTTIRPEKRLTKVVATRAGSIPSAAETICVPGGKRHRCPNGYQGTVGGTRGADSISGRGGSLHVLAAAGRDRVRGIADGDSVDCGGGRDRVTIARGSDPGLRRCERVVKR